MRPIKILALVAIMLFRPDPARAQSGMSLLNEKACPADSAVNQIWGPTGASMSQLRTIRSEPDDSAEYTAQWNPGLFRAQGVVTGPAPAVRHRLLEESGGEPLRLSNLRIAKKGCLPDSGKKKRYWPRGRK